MTPRAALPRSGLLPLLASALLLLVAPPRAGAQPADATVVFDQKFQGVISSALDADLVQFTEAEGARLTLTVKRQGKNGLSPTIELLDDTQAVIDVGGLKTQSASKATIKNFFAPYSGVYYVRVGSKNGLTGTYTVTVKGDTQDTVSLSGSIEPPGEQDEITFSARAGSELRGSIEGKSGTLDPVLVELIDPSGGQVLISGFSGPNKKGTKLTFSGILLQALGEYELRFSGKNGTVGNYAAKLEVVPPSPAKGNVYEDEVQGQPEPPTMRLKQVYFARGVTSLDGTAITLVSPFTTVEVDPITNAVLDGTLKPLYAGVNVSELVSFELGPFYGPPVVPRNGVLVLEFDQSVALSSLALDAAGLLTAQSPLSVTVNGLPVSMAAFVQDKRVILSPVVGEQVGFPASPLAINSIGNAVASPLGTGALALTTQGASVLKNTAGGKLVPRGDLLGTPDAGGTAIGFNPGNTQLDFIGQLATGPTTISFNGFLPDDRRPRLMRRYTVAGTFGQNVGDAQNPDAVTLVLNQGFSTLAKQGQGEWSGGLLVARPGETDEESVVIASNTTSSLGGGLFANTLFLKKSLTTALAPGDGYELLRAEFYEPDPSHPMDVQTFDPDNPELLNNTELSNFVELRDRDGALQPATDPIDPLSTLTVRFSEPMEIRSFQPYESFRVTDDPPVASFGFEHVGRVISAEGAKTMTFAPDVLIQFGAQAGSFERVGFGSAPLPLLFEMVSVPPADVLIGLLGSTGYQEFLNEGERSLTDLGGQPLAFQVGELTASDPVARFVLPFNTAADGSLKDTGAVVQRFLGKPQTGFDALGSPGVTFRDVPASNTGPDGNLYGPRIPDVNLFANGVLAGAPVQFFRKILDDFNPPTAGQFAPFAFGTSTPIGGFSVLGGAKLQLVYAAEHCSPDKDAFKGTYLDLTQLAYAPIGGFVIDTVIPDVSFHAGHSTIIPNTAQNGGIPQQENSGLGFRFGGHHATLGNPATPKLEGPNSSPVTNYNALDLDGSVAERHLLTGTETSTDVFQGKPLVLSNSKLFKPAGTSRTYHPLPHEPFEHVFPYDNGGNDPFNGKEHSLLLEMRTRGITSGSVATGNGFTFAVGILSSALPRFRVFAIGVGCTACCDSPTIQPGAGNCAPNCKTSFGPVVNPSINPDLMVHAAGPAPAPPGLNCMCAPHPTVVPMPLPGCTGVVQNSSTPSVLAIATGQATPTPGGSTPYPVNYGDNSRYYMVFDYLKRQSRIRSPAIRAQPSDALASVIWRAPVFDPPLPELPAGTEFKIKFRSSVNGTVFTPWVEDLNALALPGNVLNTHPDAGPFIQFEVDISNNTATLIGPALDSLVIPFDEP